MICPEPPYGIPKECKCPKGTVCNCGAIKPKPKHKDRLDRLFIVTRRKP